MCDGMLLPHWGHLLSRAACQRFAALRVRNRILDVLRFGTPMAGVYESTFEEENNVEALKWDLVFEFYVSTNQPFNFSLSNALQSGFRFRSSSAVSSFFPLQTRLPS